MQISAMRTVILFILMSGTIIHCGGTEKKRCPSKMRLDGGNYGTYFCRPAHCKFMKCAEKANGIFCRALMLGKFVNCSVSLDWTVQRINSNEISCLINPANLKYVKSIILTQKCFMAHENKFHEEKVNVCNISDKCNLKYKTCDSLLISNHTIFTCEATSKSVLLENKIIAIDISTKLPITIKANNRILNNKDSVEAGEVVQCAVDHNGLESSSSTHSYVGLTIFQKCKYRDDVSTENFCYSMNCSVKIIGYLEKSSPCVIECIPWFENHLKLTTMSEGEQVSLSVNGVTNVTIVLNDGKLKNYGRINLGSIINCEIKSIHNLQYIKTKILMKQNCGSRVVNQFQCNKRKKCFLFPNPCKDNEIVSVTCEDVYTSIINFNLVEYLRLQWNMTIKISKQKFQKIHDNDVLTVPTSVGCYVQDPFDILETTTIYQTCNSNIDEIRHCPWKLRCPLTITSIIGTINCAVICSAALVKNVYSEIILNNNKIVRHVKVTYPDTISPMIDFQGTVLHNNDVIHVNDTLLTCSLKLLNETTPRFIPETKIRIKFLIQCSSIIKSFECKTIYGCNASIAHCQFLDRVYVTCAEYYSEKINKIVLYRRIDGAWGYWYPWNAWNPPCGGMSKRVRFRKCDSPYPQNGGNGCSGADMMSESRQSVICSDQTYVGWGAWSEWSPCSLTCGTGIKMKERRCLGIKSDSTDRLCVGSSEIKTTCVQLDCAVHQRKISSVLIMFIVLSIPAAIMAVIIINCAYKNLTKKEKSKNSEPVNDPIELMYCESTSKVN